MVHPATGEILVECNTEVTADLVPRVLGKAGPSTEQPNRPQFDNSGRSLSDRLDDFERDQINGAMENAAGNIAEAARLLRTDRGNLYRRMRRLGIRGGNE